MSIPHIVVILLEIDTSEYAGLGGLLVLVLQVKIVVHSPRPNALYIMVGYGSNAISRAVVEQHALG